MSQNYRTEAKKVTALLPAYRAAGFIQKTLDSLSAQTCDSFNVIVSVDSADDDTLAICKAHCARDNRFSVVEQKRRLGYVGNSNFLLEQAESDYVLFAFHDDLLAPEYLEKLSNVLDNRPEVVMAYSDLQLTYVNGKEELCIYDEIDGIQDRVERARLMLGEVGMWWVPNRGMFRRRRAARINGLKIHAAGEFSADHPWLCHMSVLGEFARVPETLCFKFYMTGSFTRTWKRSKPQQYARYIACLRELWSSELDTVERLQVTLPFLPKLAKIKTKILIGR